MNDNETIEELKYKLAKAKDFNQYFYLTNHRVEYTGAEYLIFSSENNIVTSGKTDEEIYSYIVGYLNAYKIFSEELQKQAVQEESEEL